MKIKVALFKDKYGNIVAKTEDMEPFTESVRISGYVEIDFPDLPKEEINKNLISKLEKEVLENEIQMAKAEKMLAEKKQELALLSNA